MLKIKFFPLILCNILLTYGELDYCNMSTLCSSGEHIKCNNDGNFSETCPDDVMLLELSDQDKNDIVEAHNIKRNKTAAGEIPGFEPAERMAQMRWSEELAEMAELNVKQCEYAHDECRNIPKFPKSGQNLYGWSGPAPAHPKKHFFHAINVWFGKYEGHDMSIINEYNPQNEGGTFSLMVCDRNNHVGCAAVYFQEESKIIIACNYAYHNFSGRPVYKAGDSGSGCVDGTDPKFTALCTLCESYD